MRKRNWTLFAVLAALAALAALSIGSAGSAVAAGASASGASASGGDEATAAQRRGRRGPRGRRGRRGATGPTGGTGAAGPTGPAGPAGPGQGGGSGGVTKVFYAVNGVGATQTLIDANNLNLQNACDGAADQDIEFRTALENTRIAYTDNDEFLEAPDFDAGDSFGELEGIDDTNSVFTVMYANTVGQLVQTTLMVEDGPNSSLVSVDCLAVGTYSVL